MLNESAPVGSNQKRHRYESLATTTEEATGGASGSRDAEIVLRCESLDPYCSVGPTEANMVPL